jgi:hypothetical protein
MCGQWRTFLLLQFLDSCTIPGWSLSRKVVQVYPIGNEMCAISEFSGHRFRVGKSYHTTIYVREVDDWKIRMAYNN